MASDTAATATATNGHAISGTDARGTTGANGKGAARAVAAGQFVLGASLWVSGQQIGSLACTGLGYWVVFDAFGVGLRWVLPAWLAGSGGVRRPYG